MLVMCSWTDGNKAENLINALDQECAAALMKTEC